MDNSAQNNQQSNLPVDTSMGDGNSIPPFPVGDTQIPPVQPVTPDPTTTQPAPEVANTQVSAVPAPASPVADATAGNQPTIGEVPPPPPGDGQTVTTFKPTRGKFGAKGVIATVFGVLILVAATIVGVTQVGQVQLFQQKAGTNCAAELNTCTATCTDPESSETCNRDCRQQFEQCTSEGTSTDVDGTPVCQSGQAVCGNSCANLSTDNSNCGQCGTACTSGQSCQNGLCKTAAANPTACQPGQVLCGDYCATTNTDIRNCGGCNIKCTSGQSCQNGLCKDGGSNVCTGFWTKWTCIGADKVEGAGCQEGTPEVSTTQPEFDSGFCGVQQIDCSDNTSLQFSKEDKSGCNTASPSPGGKTMGCGGCDCGVIDANGSNNRQNCYWDGNQCFYSEAACSEGPTNGKAKCGGIGLQVNGQFTKRNGRVANGWHTATLAEVEALQAGDTVRLTVSAASANGANPANYQNFTKGRFQINGGAFIETTTYENQENDRIGIFGRIFRYDYVIPSGVTDFTIQGQVFYREGQNPGWH